MDPSTKRIHMPVVLQMLCWLPHNTLFVLILVTLER